MRYKHQGKSKSQAVLGDTNGKGLNKQVLLLSAEQQDQGTGGLTNGSQPGGPTPLTTQIHMWLIGIKNTIAGLVWVWTGLVFVANAAIVWELSLPWLPAITGNAACFVFFPQKQPP